MHLRNQLYEKKYRSSSHCLFDLFESMKKTESRSFEQIRTFFDMPWLIFDSTRVAELRTSFFESWESGDWQKKKLVLRKINDSRTICGNCLPYLLFGRALHAAPVTSELINRHIWFTVPVLSRAKSSDKQLCLGMSWLKVRRRWIRVKQQEKFTIHKNCLL